MAAAAEPYPRDPVTGLQYGHPKKPVEVLRLIELLPPDMPVVLIDIIEQYTGPLLVCGNCRQGTGSDENNLSCFVEKMDEHVRAYNLDAVAWKKMKWCKSRGPSMCYCCKRARVRPIRKCQVRSGFHSFACASEACRKRENFRYKPRFRCRACKRRACPACYIHCCYCDGEHCIDCFDRVHWYC